MSIFLTIWLMDISDFNCQWCISLYKPYNEIYWFKTIWEVLQCYISNVFIQLPKLWPLISPFLQKSTCIIIRLTRRYIKNYNILLGCLQYYVFIIACDKLQVWKSRVNDVIIDCLHTINVKSDVTRYSKIKRRRALGPFKAITDHKKGVARRHEPHVFTDLRSWYPHDMVREHGGYEWSPVL